MVTQTADPAAVAITNVAYGAGFRGTQLVQAVALALAESGGDPNALNDNPKTGDYSVGYWQINYYGGLNQPRTQQFGPPSNLRGVDPTGGEAQRNAAAAYAISGGGKDWSPWQADFSNGHYYSNLPKAILAVNQVTGGGAPGSAGGSPYALATSTGVPTATNPAAGVGLDTGAQTSNAASDHCIIHLSNTIPIVNMIPGLDNSGPCLLSTSNLRAIGGGALLVAGALIVLVGAAVLAGKQSNLTAVAGKISPAGTVVGGAIGRGSRMIVRPVSRTTTTVPEPPA